MDEYNRYRNNNERSRKNRSAANKVSFYASLAICLTAIGLAVWSTYTSYSDYQQKQSVIDELSASQVNKNVTGIVVTSTEQTTAATTQPTTASETQTTAETTTAPPETTTTVPPTTLSAVETMLQVPGSLIYPIEDAKVIKGFSKEAVYSKTMGDYRSHLGVDFECKKDSEVVAMADGIVSDIYDDERMGKVLIEDCGSYMIYYSGIDNVKLKLNESISQKDKLGNVGRIPAEKKDGTHLHVSVRVNGSYVDPLSVISNDK